MNDRVKLDILLDKLGLKSRKLEILELDHTKFQHNRLTSLDLGLMGIRQIPNGAFDMLQNLKALNLSGNKLQTLPENAFRNLTNLEMLGLVNNQLYDLPDNIFANNKKLTVINLADNNLTSLPNSLKQLPNLFELMVEKNPLTNVDDLRDYIPNN